MERVYNFSAGPSGLPVPVLEKAAKELVNYGGAGMSVMEMSHRSKAYIEIFDETVRLLRELMAIPENYKVLFMQGGASMQFSMTPINLTKNGAADYVVTGEFAKKAAKEAKKFTKVKVVASSEDAKFSFIPELPKESFSENADYLHITYNNTIFGTRYTELPETAAPIVADISSNVLSEVIDVSKFGALYAGAQKNIGPAGVTIGIIREDLIGGAPENAPILLDWKTYADNDSMYNTPPTYSIYIAKLVFEWLKEQGGVAAIQKINEEKAALLYGHIDGSSLFKNNIVKKDRSLMNVPFVTGSDELDDKFVKEAEKAGLVNLKGHRSVGGMRASIYNPMPIEGVKALIDFMKKFETNN